MLSPLDLFSDPVFRAPTLALLLLSLSSAIIGVFVFLRRRSLVGESLSHASYPGVVIGILLSTLFPVSESWEPLFVLGAALFSCLLGLFSIDLLERRRLLSSDAALTLLLTSFFGCGLMLASHVQFTQARAYRHIQIYLYGQAATMTTLHVWMYSLFSLALLSLLLLFYPAFKILLFDRTFAKSVGVAAKRLEALLSLLLVLAIVLGIRSVGVVLMSAMLLAPPIAARQFSHRFSRVLLLSALFGLLSGIVGLWSSLALSSLLQERTPLFRASLPTGPMIVVAASLFASLALLFAPERGWLIRLWRIRQFHATRRKENLLKRLWKYPESDWDVSPLLLWALRRDGLVARHQAGYALTPQGAARAAHIVRLHRLWEVYLVEYLEMGGQRVHHNAEEMEHILTPELEKKLTLFLNDPKQDPHQQPIPPR